MTREVRLAPEATTEAREASRWYEERSAGVGAALLDEVSAALVDLARWPGAGAPVFGMDVEADVRRIPLGRFPYHLVYTYTDEVVYVLALAHDRREPGYWTRRAGS